MLGVVFVGMLAVTMVLQSVPPILPLMLKDLGLSHAQGGLLMGFFALPGIIVAIPAGLLADRYNQKAIGLISLALLGVGASIVATGDTLALLALGRIVSGIGPPTQYQGNIPGDMSHRCPDGRENECSDGDPVQAAQATTVFR